MKSQSHESGSIIHVAIVSFLVVALIGAVGFIFWQNFINKSSSSASDVSKQSTGDAEAGKKSESVSYLPIDNWGLKLKLRDGMSASDFTVGSPTAEDKQEKISYLTITYKPASAIYKTCGETVFARSSDGFASVNPASPPNSKGSTALGSYAYAIAPPQNVCYDGAPNDQWDSIESKLSALPNAGWPALGDLQLQ